jgi:hypothetical protein
MMSGLPGSRQTYGRHKIRREIAMQLQQDQFVGDFEDCDSCPGTGGCCDTIDDGIKRTFPTGATRDTSEDKYDPEGFFSVLVIDRYCEYMHKNRVQSDGSLRDSDNWQKGMGFPVFMKSVWRHFLDMWKIHRGYRAFRREKGKIVEIDMEDALCGLLFNVMGYLHETLLNKLQPTAMTLKCEENNSDQKI